MSRRELPKGRWWSKTQLAAHLSHSVDWLSRNYVELIKQGMPDKDPFLKAWDSEAIKAWEDQRSLIKIVSPAAKEAAMWERQLANGEI